METTLIDRQATDQQGAPEAATSARTLLQQAMRRHAASVCIISEGAADAVNGMAVTSATSFSLDPPSMLVCVNQGASIAARLVDGVAFGLTVLGSQHGFVADAFSRKPSGRPRFDHGLWHIDTGEPPWLDDAPVNLACVVAQTMAYGSHVAIIGRVTSVRLGGDTPSLVYRDGRYG